MNDNTTNLIALIGIVGLSYFSYRYMSLIKNQVRDIDSVPETPIGEMDIESIPVLEENNGDIKMDSRNEILVNENPKSVKVTKIDPNGFCSAAGNCDSHLRSNTLYSIADSVPII